MAFFQPSRFKAQQRTAFLFPGIAATVVLFVLLAPQAGRSHPHAFVECTFSFVFDDQGLAGFRQQWTLDEMTTLSILDVVDKDRNAALRKQEVAEIETLFKEGFREFHYYNHALINGDPFKARWVTDFSAALEQGVLVYQFFVPCHVTADTRSKKVKAAVYDETFYTFVAYAQEHGESLDPSSDPLYGDPAAGPSPDDFARFSDAVRLQDFCGEVRVEGAADGFEIATRVERAPEMAYFFEQITPEAFVLEFRIK